MLCQQNANNRQTGEFSDCVETGLQIVLRNMLFQILNYVHHNKLNIAITHPVTAPVTRCYANASSWFHSVNVNNKMYVKALKHSFQRCDASAAIC